MSAADRPSGAADGPVRGRKPRQYTADPAESSAFRKVSVTIPDAVLDEARERAGVRGLSAYVTEAVEAQLAVERLQDLVNELDEEYGPVPDAMVAEAAAAWPER